MNEMAVDVKELDVHIGDVVEIDGRRYDVVQDGDGGVTLEPAIAMSLAETHADHGSRPRNEEQFGEVSGELPFDDDG